MVGGHKRTSKYKNRKQVLLSDGVRIERDFVTEIDDWKVLDDEDDAEGKSVEENEYILSPDGVSQDEVFPVKIIQPQDHHKQEV